MLKDFKAFISKGNVMDLAIGVIIGGAFGKIIDSLVADVIMPIIGKVTGGGIDFSNYFFALDGSSYPTLAAAKEKGAAVLAYGNFITVGINFLLLAFCVFVLMKWVNAIIPPAPPPPPPGPSAEEKLLGEIRDLLAARR